MKLTISLALVFVVSFCRLSSQEVVAMKISIKPETTYRQTVEQTSYNEITFSGKKSFLKKLKENGVDNPQIVNNKVLAESVIKTGELVDGRHFQLTMEITQKGMGGGTSAMPEKLLILGHGSIDSMPVLDSIVSDRMDEEFKQIFMTAMQSMLSQLQLPERQVRVGDSSSTDLPMSLPVAGMTIEMNVRTTYKLLKVVDGIADFDIVVTCTLKSGMDKIKITASGSGGGKMLYDIANNFFRKYQVENEIKLKVKMEDYEFSLRGMSNQIVNAEIKPNPSR